MTQTIINYSQWENAITEIVCDFLECTRSDGQGIIEANEFYMAQAWSLGLEIKEAAEFIIRKITNVKS